MKLLFKKRKSEHYHWILHIWVRLSAKLQLKVRVFYFLDQTCPKDVFLSKTNEVNTTMEFSTIKLVKVSNFFSNKQFWILDQIYREEILKIKTKKSEQPLWILNIVISLSANYQVKPILLIFWTKFAQKRYCQSKTDEMNTTTELWIFELV